MIGEIRQNFTEASASVGLVLATALNNSFVNLQRAFQKPSILVFETLSERPRQIWTESTQFFFGL